MDENPTPKQLGYLGALGYEGEAPTSKSEASVLITALRDGSTPKQAESLLLMHRRVDA